MPLPTPHSGEDQATYVERRTHRALASEFPDTDQRNAVIFKTWRKHRGEAEEEKKAHQRLSDKEYAHLQDIPVFKEHSYFRKLRNKDGTPQLDVDGNPVQRVEHYDLKAMRAIAENCNQETETGSYAPITALHTGKRKTDGTIEQPEVLGFAGPYRLGMYGNEERDDGSPFKGKWAIYADEFWFKDKAHRAREMPRRSPEVYVGRPIEDRFLDPITALGAETPALDMGIHYHLNKKGDLVEQYSGPNMTVHYAEGGTKCITCGKSINKRKDAHVHHLTASDKRVFGCSDCNESGKFDEYIDNLARQEKDQYSENHEDLVSAVRKHEAAKDLDSRNEVARKFFSKTKNRKVKVGEHTVETWHDPQSRNWITETKHNSTGHEVANSEYTGHQHDAAVAHAWAIGHSMDSQKMNDKAKYARDESKEPAHTFLTPRGYKDRAETAHRFSKSDKSQAALDASLAAGRASDKADDVETQDQHITAHEAHIKAANAHLEAASHHKGGASENLHKNLSTWHGNHAEFHTVMANEAKKQNYAAAAMPGPTNVAVPTEVKNKAQYDDEPTPLPHYDEHRIRKAIRSYKDWSRAERRGMDSVEDEVMHHIKHGGGNKFVQHFTNHILPGLMNADTEQYHGPGCKDEYSEEELQPIRDKVAAWHAENIKHHTEELAKAEAAGDNRAIKKHKMHLNWHKKESEENALHASLKDATPMEVLPTNTGDNRNFMRGGAELRQNFSMEMEDAIAQYVADPETVNACVEAMLQTQVVKRIEQFLDSQDAPVNPKQEMDQQAAQAVVEQEQGLPGQQQPGQEAEQPQPGSEPPPGEEEEEGEEPEPTAEAPPPGSPPSKKGKPMSDENDKDKFALQELQRDFQVKHDELVARYDEQQAQISELLQNNTQLQAERNQAVRERKIIELRRAGYVFDERQEIAKYSQASEEVFQARLDAIVSFADRAPIGSPVLFTPGLDLPEPATAEVGQYGGAGLTETEQIIQYCMEKNQEGEYPSWEEAKKEMGKQAS